MFRYPPHISFLDSHNRLYLYSGSYHICISYPLWYNLGMELLDKDIFLGHYTASKGLLNEFLEIR